MTFHFWEIRREKCSISQTSASVRKKKNSNCCITSTICWNNFNLTPWSKIFLIFVVSDCHHCKIVQIGYGIICTIRNKVFTDLVQGNGQFCTFTRYVIKVLFVTRTLANDFQFVSFNWTSLMESFWIPTHFNFSAVCKSHQRGKHRSRSCRLRNNNFKNLEFFKNGNLTYVQLLS